MIYAHVDNNMIYAHVIFRQYFSFIVAYIFIGSLVAFQTQAPTVLDHKCINPLTHQCLYCLQTISISLDSHSR